MCWWRQSDRGEFGVDTAATELSYVSATRALAGFASGEFSPVELMDAVIERALATEDRVNAFAERYFTEATAMARAAADRYTRGEQRPLEGLPVALKEEHPIAGLPLREGSTLLRDNIAHQTHPIVDRIVRAGGIPHARSTTPEFCVAGFTHSALWGVTTNPWNRDYSPGGSSGGSAAALAAGSTTLATGSDIAGSLRIPASSSGVVGFKPPQGRVPALAPFTVDHYCQDGPMARTVDDCALLQRVIAGHDPRDPVSLPDPPPLRRESPDVSALRVGVCARPGDYPVEPAMIAATERAGAVLEHAGASVEHVELHWNRREIMAAAFAHYGTILTGSVYDEQASRGGELEHYTEDFCARAVDALAEYGLYRAALTESDIYADLARLFAHVDVVLAPTLGIPALVAGQDYVEGSLIVDGVRLAHHLEGALTVPFNLANRHPVLNVPCGLDGNRIPTGVQVAGRTYADATVFAVGRVIADRDPWYSDPAWRPSLQ